MLDESDRRDLCELILALFWDPLAIVSYFLFWILL